MNLKQLFFLVIGFVPSPFASGSSAFPNSGKYEGFLQCNSTIDLSSNPVAWIEVLPDRVVIQICDDEGDPDCTNRPLREFDLSPKPDFSGYYDVSWRGTDLLYPLTCMENVCFLRTRISDYVFKFNDIEIEAYFTANIPNQEGTAITKTGQCSGTLRRDL